MEKCNQDAVQTRLASLQLPEYQLAVCVHAYMHTRTWARMFSHVHVGGSSSVGTLQFPKDNLTAEARTLASAYAPV